MILYANQKPDDEVLKAYKGYLTNMPKLINRGFQTFTITIPPPFSEPLFLKKLSPQWRGDNA